MRVPVTSHLGGRLAVPHENADPRVCGWQSTGGVIHTWLHMPLLEQSCMSRTSVTPIETSWDGGAPEPHGSGAAKG